MHWIIWSIIGLLVISYYIIRYKFHWVYAKNKEEREDAKIRQKFLFEKDSDIGDYLEEMDRVQKKRKKKNLLKSRKDKLDKIFKKQK